jgi:peptidoglycan/LPS O-acetylase OafA/YrhL
MHQARRVHLAYLDGIRGWAAVFVAIHHLWQFVIMRPGIEHPPGWFKALAVFKYGQYAVVVFIVLSGYCLMLPVARSVTNELAGGVRGFIARRAKRILVPYYAALAISLALVALLPSIAEPTDPTFAPANVLAHVFLVHNWFEQYQWTIDGPLWTIAIEWQIYFVFALLLLPLWRRFGPALTVAVAFGIGLLPVFAGYKFASPWFLGLFAFGMLAASINFAPGKTYGPDEPGTWEKLALGLALVVAALTGAKIDAFTSPHPLIETVLGLATAAFLVASTRRLQLGRESSFVTRVFEHPVSMKLGLFSYSIYLMHCPVLKALNLPIKDAQLSPVLSFALLIGVALPAALLFCYGFHRVFERPFMTVGAGQFGGASLIPDVAGKSLQPAGEPLKSTSG